MKSLQEKITSWIRKKVKDASAKGTVIGVSGGIDSAVVAALCKIALGKKSVLCLILPCQTPKSEISDARFVCRSLGIRHRTIDLAPVFRKIRQILPPAGRVPVSNIKPRLRMITLYYFANKLNYLVAGTGNRSELMLGYFTKYGDGGVDILPLGALLKKDVIALAMELNIPEKIIFKKPSAGLWPGQTDEDEMGLTYKYIDDILSRSGKGKIAGGNERIRNLADRAKHKLALPEICPL